ncbi:MAG: DUF1080 domain-containing protein [Gemmatimonadaceae bacterium]|nr:DUF1080 domain-containing protein [Gemmatimonadaceae bacterium]
MSVRVRATAAVALTVVSSILATRVAAQPVNTAVAGRWDLTVQGPDREYPSWLEVYLSGSRTLVGRFVHDGGSARPVAKVTFANNVVRFAIPPQWEGGNGELQVEATLANDTLRGTLTTVSGEKHALVGVRAPMLRRTAAPVWDKPIALFDGTTMNAWEPMGDNSRWSVVNGILTNARGGANLRTKQVFEDFKLHAEVRLPPGGNSGIYLRGRHEVQVEDSVGVEPKSTHMGGVYGFLVPNENVYTGPNQWQTFDITLIGRRVTVVLNGKAIIVDQTIPGITGGAIDSKEGEPGPIYLQGDHGRIEYRNIVITPARSAK